MIREICIIGSANNKVLQEYLDFNRIDYSTRNFWNTDIDKAGVLYIPDELYHQENCLLVMDMASFTIMCELEISRTRLIDFSKKNYVWVWSDIDGLLTLLVINPELMNHVDKIDNIKWFIDGSSAELELNNNIVKFPTNWFMKMPRIRLGVSKKLNCQYDYLLTTITKSGREHRSVLLNDLYSRQIKKHGLISVHNDTQNTNEWVGETPIYNDWYGGYPSMDLYRNCWFEIVPETLYKNGHYFTEKTNKPIATKTPFLTVSSQGYLTYLESLGFRTFKDLIDESYDKQDRIEDRVSLMLDQAEDIIKNGSESFYNASKEILDHNQSRLQELSGSFELVFDSFITDQLEKIGKIL